MISTGKKKKSKKFVNFLEHNGTYCPAETEVRVPQLEPGMYTLDQDDRGTLYFSSMDAAHDSLLDLPSPEYKQVMQEIGHFLKPETREIYKKMGYLYKRSSLLHGLPGTGKTCIATRTAQHVIEGGGIVLFNPHPKLLPQAYKAIGDIQPDATVLVIFEELDVLLQRFEGDMLNILDGEMQKDNVIYIATTNYLDKIPLRIRRPGRFSSVVEVGYPIAAARSAYLEHKGVDAELIADWTTKTAGMSIDELKETVVAVLCLDQKLDAVVSRIMTAERAAARVQEADAAAEKAEEILIESSDRAFLDALTGLNFLTPKALSNVKF